MFLKAFPSFFRPFIFNLMENSDVLDGVWRCPGDPSCISITVLIWNLNIDGNLFSEI